jgi:hypothetical protein
MSFRPVVQVPQCAVCKKPVERLQYETDPVTCATYIAVSCHGQTEKARISYLDWLEMTEMTMGEAFRTEPTIPAARSLPPSENYRA